MPRTVVADMKGVTRLRIVVNDPNAPSQACGFENVRTVLVLGDTMLSR